MDQKDKALKIALMAIGALALAMFLYYFIAWRNRTTAHDVDFKAQGDQAQEAKSELAGIYTLSEPVEGLERRLGFFTVNKRDDGSGSFFGTAKVDSIASTQDATAYIPCNDVNIGERDFFLKCVDPALGQISFAGEWEKSSSGAIQARGRLMWSKDATEVTSKSLTLTHGSGG